jgi:uncharacterized lipoprotein YbaY
MNSMIARVSKWLMVFLLAGTIILSGCSAGEQTEMDDEVLVSGDITIVDSQSSFAGATVYVRLEDISQADAASTVVAEQVLRDISDTDLPLQFSLTGELFDEQANYIVTVHVDVDDNGALNTGDFITMESYPVLTHGAPKQISVQVRPI